ncbi:hypothetical protein [Plantibacter sp. CFBP 8775]|uniref:hypothetical protein n=1 Tax=Plantibacter sp. CFBP 8775 TaxID=2774038 RepID=UPI00177B5B9F|nr:hypothetical protein [Plantibacter sp. CFBP 8775]MBD8101884.1 hypothetical protein [Plantibacter sp. CFBP 8775]
MAVHPSIQSETDRRPVRSRAAFKIILVGLTAASVVLAQTGPASASERESSSGGPVSTAAAAEPSDLSTDTIETHGAPLVLAIVGAVLATGMAADQAGRTAGARVYYAGVTLTQYQGVKWQTRATAVAALGVIMGPVFMASFEATFYGLAS